MTRKQRGIKERKKKDKKNNLGRRKGRSSKKDKAKNKQERLWNY